MYTFHYHITMRFHCWEASRKPDFTHSYNSLPSLPLHLIQSISLSCTFFLAFTIMLSRNCQIKKSKSSWWSSAYPVAKHLTWNSSFFFHSYLISAIFSKDLQPHPCHLVPLKLVSTKASTLLQKLIIQKIIHLVSRKQNQKIKTLLIQNSEK